MSETLTARCPAKLNLALAVGPPRPDGLHPICSWMTTIDLADELTITRLPPDRLSRYAILWHAEARRPREIDWSITKDLAVRAHLALERYCERALPLQMKLEKRIPLGSGLGGGSSDAAGMLHAVNELFELGLSDDTLAGIGLELGADVPFLVYGGNAIVGGVGDDVDRQPTADTLHAVLVFPESACETAAVYRRFDELGASEFRPDAIRTLATGGGEPFNDLMAPALDLTPTLATLREAIAGHAERPAHLSGSGSTLFVRCDDELHADFLARRLEEALGVPAVATRTGERVVVEAVTS
ncbi:MAG: 4-(cytidine 5'-diphospho)-2-C-methyl-D-erythritol kinase [Phycisphaerales bacterium]|nr:4-(cytidine 5'-diphospho)-2-C-methyl-D-erythritol kinase [Phycisphaerales bacterium]